MARFDRSAQFVAPPRCLYFSGRASDQSRLCSATAKRRCTASGTRNLKSCDKRKGEGAENTLSWSCRPFTPFEGSGSPHPSPRDDLFVATCVRQRRPLEKTDTNGNARDSR